MKRILLLVAVSLLTNALLQAQTYTDIEAVEYDYTQNRYFVSNNTSIIARSSNGTLSFFGSAQAAYGMEVGDGHLFAIKGSAVRAYDLNTATLVMTATVPGAGFLNGMAIDTARNHVYVTDFSTKKIIKIDYSNFATPVITTFVANTVQTPNGITYDELNDRLVYVTWGSSAKVKGVNITTAAQTDLYTTTLSNIDGIDNDGQGNFYVASWSPARISKFDNTFSSAPVTVTSPALSSPADISYARQTDTLAIANAGNNTVVFIGFQSTVGTVELANAIALEAYPNPVSAASQLRFNLTEDAQVQIVCSDMTGKQSFEILNTTLMAGEQLVQLQGLNLPAGTYVCSLVVNGQLVAAKTLLFD